MKSNIRYVIDKDNNQKKLIRELLNKNIQEYEKENDTHIIRTSFLYEFVLYSKYIIEDKNLNIQKIVQGDIKEIKHFLKEKFKDFGPVSIDYYIDSLDLPSILKKIIFEDYEISTYIDRVLDKYIDPKKKYLLIATHDIDYINYNNIDVCIDIHSKKLESKKIIDEISGIHYRKYYNNLKDIDYKKYDELIYINDGKEYKDIYEILSKLRYIGNIIMKCKYVDVSRYEDDIICIEEVLLDKEKTYIKYKPLSDPSRLDGMLIKEISDIEDNELKSIIDTKEKIKDICIHVTREDFKNHVYRIGFNAYNKDLDINKAKILRLIAHNKHLIKRLRELDDDIAKEIDELIVR